MLRIIALMIIDTDERTGKPGLRDITGYAAKAMDDRLDRDRWGLKVGGCGMDMCFATVYNLGRALFPEGFGETLTTTGAASGKERRTRPISKAESARLVKAGWNAYGRNGDTSGWDNDGGYALKAVTI
jgi:hypothetical protein